MDVTIFKIIRPELRVRLCLDGVTTTSSREHPGHLGQAGAEKQGGHDEEPAASQIRENILTIRKYFELERLFSGMFSDLFLMIL